MRRRTAFALVVVTGVLVVAMALAFAVVQTIPTSAEAPVGPARYLAKGER